MDRGRRLAAIAGGTCQGTGRYPRVHPVTPAPAQLAVSGRAQGLFRHTRAAVRGGQGFRVVAGLVAKMPRCPELASGVGAKKLGTSTSRPLLESDGGVAGAQVEVCPRRGATRSDIEASRSAILGHRGRDTEHATAPVGRNFQGRLSPAAIAMRWRSESRPS